MEEIRELAILMDICFVFTVATFSTLPDDKRRAVMLAMVPRLQQQGFTPEEININLEKVTEAVNILKKGGF